MMPTDELGRQALKLVVALLITQQLFTLIQPSYCLQYNVPDDDQLETYQHEDIGRISGGAQVAPVVSVRQPQPQQQPQQQHHHVAPIKPKTNRITLVPKRDPDYAPIVPVAEAPPPAPVAVAPQPQQQQLIAAQLPAPIAQPNFAPLAPAAVAPLRHHHHHQALAPASHTNHHHLNQATTLLDTNRPGAAFTLALPNRPQVGTGNPGTVSARHSALMAQVAAERAAVGALEQPPVLASIGSPIDASSNQQVQQASVAATQPQYTTTFSQPAPQASSFIPNNNAQLINQIEEPQVAPSFEQVLGRGCPLKGVFSFENKDYCDRYYLCTNGTFTEEACPNGLLYGGEMGAVYQHCTYNWKIDCARKKAPEPISSPGCPWQFGIFPIASNGQCSIDYFACEWGVPETKRCSPEGLFYDDRIKGCQWADQLGCKSEALLNFKCPAEDEGNAYWPYPRYYHNTQNVIVCVNEQPRLVHCTEDQLVDPASLACIDVKKKRKQNHLQH